MNKREWRKVRPKPSNYKACSKEIMAAFLKAGGTWIYTLQNQRDRVRWQIRMAVDDVKSTPLPIPAIDCEADE